MIVGDLSDVFYALDPPSFVTLRPLRSDDSGDGFGNIRIMPQDGNLLPVSSDLVETMVAFILVQFEGIATLRREQIQFIQMQPALKSFVRTGTRC